MATCGRPIFSRVPRMFVNSAVLSPRGRSDTTQFTRVPYGATNSKLMAGALITTLMREDHLSKASVYRYLGVGDATQFTSYSQTASILEYTFLGVGQKTPLSYSPQHSVRGRLPEGEHYNGLDMPCRIG
jgi:hypothetical protein